MPRAAGLLAWERDRRAKRARAYPTHKSRDPSALAPHLGCPLGKAAAATLTHPKGVRRHQSRTSGRASPGRACGTSSGTPGSRCCPIRSRRPSSSSNGACPTRYSVGAGHRLVCRRPAEADRRVAARGVTWSSKRSPEWSRGGSFRRPLPRPNLIGELAARGGDGWYEPYLPHRELDTRRRRYSAAPLPRPGGSTNPRPGLRRPRQLAILVYGHRWIAQRQLRSVWQAGLPERTILRRRCRACGEARWTPGSGGIDRRVDAGRRC
jgi:hypothetical protein